MGGKTDAVGPGECGKRGLSFADEDLAGIKQCMPNVCETSAAGAAVPPLLFQLSRNRKTSDSPREILRPRRIAFRIHVEIGNVASKNEVKKEENCQSMVASTVFFAFQCRHKNCHSPKRKWREKGPL